MKRSHMHVGFVVHVMQVAGAEVLVTETIRRLSGEIRPTIFCLDTVGLLGEQLLRDGVEVICLNRRPGRDLGVAWRMAQVIRSRQIAVLHAHQYTPFFYAALAKLCCRVPTRLILTEHGRHYPDVVSPLRRATNRLFLDPLADAVNAVCSFSSRALSRVDGFSGRRIGVIENGIDLKRYSPVAERNALRRRLNLNPARRYVVNIARFHPVKDHATLVRAFHELSQTHSDVDLLLVGDGPLRADLEKAIKTLGLEGRVHLLGVRKDVPDLLQASDVFALTSVSEAASLTVLEAMASGVPVVVTRVGGNPEMVRHGIEGLLVPRGDIQATAAALRGLLDDPVRARRLAQAAQERVRERYRLEQTVASYLNLYRRLCRGACVSANA